MTIASDDRDGYPVNAALEQKFLAGDRDGH
jgi:hypothetical protein